MKAIMNSSDRGRFAVDDAAWDEEGDETVRDMVLLIDPRVLDRECLARSLATQDPSLDVVAVSSADEWHKRGDTRQPAAVLLIAGSRKISDQGVGGEIQELAEEFSEQPVVIIADSDDLGQILKALDAGAKGYIPSNVGVGVAAEAILLARAGGVFVPASGVLAMREVINSTSSRVVGLGNLFTAREAEVAEALRRGKANKIIAYELQLCESTVKVHIRNIMKKLNATNRTEVAYKIREMLP
ncbi:two component LuxR family transcriptional regulator [Nitratireductor pacificus pht-3B]|uniref:Two component LuxR family transcriptional regulator n=1 Tax=Nitratireductor pacificus pht-3B TaxID=391937 RepID=K2MGW9_9HYPH|nr:two component LuxR family transcriptional regulator [Nitratireductor pacificus pht-3B]